MTQESRGRRRGGCSRRLFSDRNRMRRVSPKTFRARLSPMPALRMPWWTLSPRATILGMRAVQAIDRAQNGYGSRRFAVAPADLVHRHIGHTPVYVILTME